MAKKYLLYIHDERFDSEKQKSALINRLLETHYDIKDLEGDPTTHTMREVLKKNKLPMLVAVLDNLPGNPHLCRHNMLSGTCGYASCKKR